MECIFCKIVKGELTSKTLYEDDIVKVIMDANPIRDGHSLVIPKKHFTDFMELDDETTKHIFNTAKNMTKVLMEKLNAKSVTLLINYGEDQMVKHYHLHLLPDFGTTSQSLAKRTIEENYNMLKGD